MVAAVIAEAKRKQQKPSPQRSSPEEEADSENTDSASETESCSGDEASASESTITDSGVEEEEVESRHSGRGSNRKKSSVGPPALSQQTSEGGLAFDLFISAAEALSNTVPSDVALHDHSYSLPPTTLTNNVDGLSLIAAAAAVVSPSFSRSASSGRLPGLSPVRAPRGRPPNTQKRGSATSTKLAPTLLSPVGSSTYVPLSDIKPATFRGRTRSAPTERPRSTLQLSRNPSSLAKMSISSGGKAKGLLPPASYTRYRDSSPSSSSSAASPSGGHQSLKSMIASHPQQANNNSNAAFEALVNVAVAQSPVELPKTSSPSTIPKPLSLSVQPSVVAHGSSRSYPTTPMSAPHHQSSQDGTVAFLDVNQALNLLALASITQQPQAGNGGGGGGGTSSHQLQQQQQQQTVTAFSAQPLLAAAPGLSVVPASSLSGATASQNVSVTSCGAVRTGGRETTTGGGWPAASSASLSGVSMVPPAIGSPPIATATCTMSVKTLLSHIFRDESSLTSASSSPVSSTSNSSSSSSSGSAVYLSATPHDTASLASAALSSPALSLSTVLSNLDVQPTPHNAPASASSLPVGQPNGVATAISSSSETQQNRPPSSSFGDDLSNLNLLSSLVAAVAAQSSAAAPTADGTRPTVAISALMTTTTTTTSSSSPSVVAIPEKEAGYSAAASVPLLQKSTLSDGKIDLPSVDALSPDDFAASFLASNPHKAAPLPVGGEDSVIRPSHSQSDVEPQSSVGDDLPRSVIRASLSPRSSSQQQQQQDSALSSPPSPPRDEGSKRDELPRCVVRTNPHHVAHHHHQQQQQTCGSAESDMTASLASIIPHNFTSPQSALMRYTRSLSLQHSASGERRQQSCVHACVCSKYPSD